MEKVLWSYLEPSGYSLESGPFHKHGLTLIPDEKGITCLLKCVVKLPIGMDT